MAEAVVRQASASMPLLYLVAALVGVTDRPLGLDACVAATAEPREDDRVCPADVGQAAVVAELDQCRDRLLTRSLRLGEVELGVREVRGQARPRASRDCPLADRLRSFGRLDKHRLIAVDRGGGRASQRQRELELLTRTSSDPSPMPSASARSSSLIAARESARILFSLRVFRRDGNRAAARSPSSRLTLPSSSRYRYACSRW